MTGKVALIAPPRYSKQPGGPPYYGAKGNNWLNPKLEEFHLFGPNDFVSIITPDFDEKEVFRRLLFMSKVNSELNLNIETAYK